MYNKASAILSPPSHVNFTVGSCHLIYQYDESGFFADPDPDFKSPDPDPSINKPMGSK